MEEIKSEYCKRSQKNYSMSFKLSVVCEIERGPYWQQQQKKKYGIQGGQTVINWLRKHDTFNWENQIPSNMPKSKE